ncbi:histidine phosphatase family protein [Paenibacillus soyae]|uniref:Histidine phosphatase family protein n=1 Tax=Paenibacillus soyae TaxID=2969249 RepID=A0A9X2MT06_9BACL|nr:histidine phosphatase family protein [Paenibacillus soyae]MCR2805930.1 histidine phosphatase family protein [Paenibacillus soyae]
MIYVVRHGQTDWNREGRLQGRKGLELNEEGQRQAEALRERLGAVAFDYVYSSPQARAVQTAELATGAKAVIDGRLDVFDLGEADGLHRSVVRLAGAIPDPNVYPGVEDIQRFMGRVFSFMQELEKKLAGEEANILIAGHRCTTGAIGAYFEGLPADGNILKLSSGNGDYRIYDFEGRMRA